MLKLEKTPILPKLLCGIVNCPYIIIRGPVNRSQVLKYLVKKTHMPGSAEPKASVDCNKKEIK